MTTRLDGLARACEEALIEGMPVSLKAAIDDLLSKGARPAAILARVRRQTGGPNGKRSADGTRREGGLTHLAVEAYLSRQVANRSV